MCNKCGFVVRRANMAVHPVTGSYAAALWWGLKTRCARGVGSYATSGKRCEVFSTHCTGTHIHPSVAACVGKIIATKKNPIESRLFSRGRSKRGSPGP